MRYFFNEKHNEVYQKNTRRDLVSLADRNVEKLIVSAIHDNFPDHDIYGEESGRTGSGAEFCWVIDPIDGTSSFVEHHPYFSISIGLKRRGVAVAGCVYAPALNLLFSAEKGQGAFENGQRIHGSSVDTLEDAVMTVGFACLRAGMKDNILPVFNRLAPVVRDIKRCGSAALDLCFIASGRYDLYCEKILQEYDVAAGALIAEEAGVRITDWNGGADWPFSGILAANPRLHPKALDFFRGTAILSEKK